MDEQKSPRSLTQIIKKNQVDELTAKVEYLEKELRAKEILLINLEKLSSLGQFIREIVHELKNPLTAISGFTELGKIAKTEQDKEEYLEKIPKFINQITSRLSQFRSMTFNTGINYSNIDLIQVLVECLATLELLKPKGCEIESNFLCSDSKINGDAEQWIQVFLGISRMFFNVMKEIKSTLHVRVKSNLSSELISGINEINNSSIPTPIWNKNLEKHNKWIRIIFENRKIAISEEKINKVFDLWKKNEVSSKIEELGLLIACDIVQRHQGIIYTKKIQSAALSLNICVPKIN